MKIKYIKYIKKYKGLIDKQYIIRCALSPTIIKMFRPEYLLLMRMLNYNITFDDKSDKLFIYDFDIVS